MATSKARGEWHRLGSSAEGVLEQPKVLAPQAARVDLALQTTTFRLGLEKKETPVRGHDASC